MIGGICYVVVLRESFLLFSRRLLTTKSETYVRIMMCRWRVSQSLIRPWEQVF